MGHYFVDALINKWHTDSWTLWCGWCGANALMYPAHRCDGTIWGCMDVFIITTICLENSSESDIVWNPPYNIAKVNPDFRSLHPLLATVAYTGPPTSISLSMLWISPSPCLAFNGVTHRRAAQLRSSGIYVMRLLINSKHTKIHVFKRRVHLDVR
jgi:hypothetical protein